jgi:hypothetical protein
MYDEALGWKSIDGSRNKTGNDSELDGVVAAGIGSLVRDYRCSWAAV